MKHVVVVTTSFPENKAGAEAAGSFVADFSKALSRHCRVTVLAPGSNPAGAPLQGNLEIRRFRVPYEPLSRLNPYRPFHWPMIVSTLRSGQKALDRIAAESIIDHIFALWALPSGHWARRIAKKTGVPYSVWVLGSDIWTLGKIPLVKGLLRKVLRDSRCCFADGFLLKEDVEKIAGRSCEFLASTRDIPLMDKKTLSDAPPYRLTFLGRWHPNKGTDILMESLGLLSDGDWGKIAEVRICGGGPLEEAVRSGCAALAREGRPVVLRGYLGKEEAAALLMDTDYLLIPSRIESIPVVFSDAMKSRCPVVAMPVGDLPALLDRYGAGVLSRGMDPLSFAEAIHAILSLHPLHFESGLVRAGAAFDLNATVETFLRRADLQ
jgi:glycosyltransferase involved in cell wall biosynthesis